MNCQSCPPRCLLRAESFMQIPGVCCVCMSVLLDSVPAEVLQPTVPHQHFPLDIEILSRSHPSSRLHRTPDRGRLCVSHTASIPALRPADLESEVRTPPVVGC